MRVAAVQMVSVPEVRENLGAAQRLIEEAAASDAQLIVLPEYFCHMGAQDTDKLRHAEQDGRGVIQDFLSQTAKRLRVTLVGGTVPLWPDGQPAGGDGKGHGAGHGNAWAPPATPPPRVYNSMCVYGPDGARQARYDKIHLFCFNAGGEAYDEAKTLMPGAVPTRLAVTPTTHPTAPWEVALSICYDLRFPELYRRLNQELVTDSVLSTRHRPLDVIVVSAAFTHTTGQAHWELLLRARAVENQCYVIASAQGGLHPTGRRTWGHSMVIDPWGDIVDVLPTGEGVVLATLSQDKIQAVRNKLPALSHRVLF